MQKTSTFPRAKHTNHTKKQKAGTAYMHMSIRGTLNHRLKKQEASMANMHVSRIIK
jgi:hypothetical protein